MEWAAVAIGVLLVLILIEETGQYLWKNRLYDKWISQEDTSEIETTVVETEKVQKPNFLYRLAQGAIRTFFYLLLVLVKVLRIDKAYQFIDAKLVALKIRTKKTGIRKYSFKQPVEGLKHIATTIKRHKKSSSH
jgi:divalent metal cation (Fe/Co/Zn/Cd) transporter